MSHTTCTRMIGNHVAAWCRTAARDADLGAMGSAPFGPPERGRIAVKVVTDTGMEMTAVSMLGELQP